MDWFELVERSLPYVRKNLCTEDIANIKKWARSTKPDEYIGGKEDPYMKRWYLKRTPEKNIYLHQFLRDDEDRALHDHPWNSNSLILSGHYLEYIKEDDSQRLRFGAPGQILHRPAEFTHRIGLFGLKEKRNPVWTLFHTGPRIRAWGFHCPKGWVPWQEFCAPNDKGLVGKGCA